MSARCEVRLGTQGESEACGDPADEHCINCDRALCLEHAARTLCGRYRCPGPACDR